MTPVNAGTQCLLQLLPVVMWKIETVPNAHLDLIKMLSRQMLKLSSGCS